MNTDVHAGVSHQGVRPLVWQATAAVDILGQHSGDLSGFRHWLAETVTVPATSLAATGCRNRQQCTSGSVNGALSGLLYAAPGVAPDVANPKEDDGGLG